MLRVGIVGIGFMGMVHYLTYQKLRGVRVVAICERDPQRLKGDWRSIKGNFGPRGDRMDLSGVAAYCQIDELLNDEEVDVVDVTLPPAMHADVSIRAMKAGKDVFCEKPMALRLPDCRKMIKASETGSHQLLVGHVLPFFPEYAWALKTINSGKYGKLLGGSFKRVISDPQWLADYWIADQIGGPMLDLHVHDAHFIRLVFGMPRSLVCSGRMRDGLAENWHTQFDYGEDGPTVHAHSGVIRQQGRSFNHGFEIHLERATLVFEFAVIGDQGRYLCPPTLLTSDGKVKRPRLPEGDPMSAFQRELKEVVRCLRYGEMSAILDGALAHDAVLLCKKQSESLSKGISVRV